jgi:hypothetical protein
VVQGPWGWYGGLGGNPGASEGGGRLRVGSGGLRPQSARPEASGRAGKLWGTRDASGGLRPHREATGRRRTYLAASGHDQRLWAACTESCSLRPQPEAPGKAPGCTRLRSATGGTHVRGQYGGAGQCGAGRYGSGGGMGVREGGGAHRRLGVVPVAQDGGAWAYAAPEAWGGSAQLGGGSAQLWGDGDGAER